MKRTLLVGTLGLVLGFGAAFLPTPTADARSKDDPCCKHCHKGKACGNSCISRDKECHQPPGCACDT